MEIRHDSDKVASESERAGAEKRKNKLFQNYCEENVRDVLNEIRSTNLTCYAASRKYKIPYSTLNDRLRGKHSSQHGNERVLSKEQEEELVCYVIQCSQKGNPQQTNDILRAAAKISAQNPDKTKHFSKELPSLRWFHDFRQRHPEISRRKPQVIGKASADVAIDKLKDFFESLQ
jgi:Tc5 transposase DNA-binding domain